MPLIDPPDRLSDLRKHGMHCLPRGRSSNYTGPTAEDQRLSLVQQHVRAVMDKRYELLEALTAFVVMHGIDPLTLHLYQKSTSDGYCWWFSHPRLEAQVSDPAPTGGTGGHLVRRDAPPLPPPDGAGGRRKDAAEAARHDS